MTVEVTSSGWNAQDLTALLGKLHQSESVLDVVNRDSTGSVQTITDGQLAVTYFTPLRTITISAISFCSGTLSSTPTLVRFGLFTAAANDDLTLVAATANDTAIFAGNSTVYKRSLDTGGGLPATYTLLKGTRYAVGYLLVGGTPGTVRSSATLTVISALAPRVTAIKTGQTDLGNVATVANASNAPWARLEV